MFRNSCRKRIGLNQILKRTLKHLSTLCCESTCKDRLYVDAHWSSWTVMAADNTKTKWFSRGRGLNKCDCCNWPPSFLISWWLPQIGDFIVRRRLFVLLHGNVGVIRARWECLGERRWLTAGLNVSQPLRSVCTLKFQKVLIIFHVVSENCLQCIFSYYWISNWIIASHNHNTSE